MKYEDIRSLLKNYIMNTYDIRPSLAEKTVEEMFKNGTEFISKEEQKKILEDGNGDSKIESERINMEDIKTLIIEAADKQDLTYAEDFNGRAYALMDVDWIGYFDTLDEVLEYLGISEEIDGAENEEV